MLLAVSNGLVIASMLMLIVSKIPDFTTTYQGIQQTGNPNLEQNPIARGLFNLVGVKPAFLLLALVYLSIVALIPWMTHQTALYSDWVLPISETQAVFSTSLLVFIGCTFTSITQWQAAIYNKTGKMHTPLNQVYRCLQWFYRYR